MKYGKKFWLGLIGGLPAGLIMFSAFEQGWYGPVILMVFHFSMCSMYPWWEECQEAGLKKSNKV